MKGESKSMERKDAIDMLREKISDELFSHCLRVEETAVKLAHQHGVDVEKASLAGLLHDFGKTLPERVLLELAVKYDNADYFTQQEPALLHAPVGAWLLKYEMGIDDFELLEAVRYHTTGSEGISLFSKLIYLADFIEPGRSCPGVNRIREIVYDDLDTALLCVVDLTIKYVLDRQKIVHPNSISFRNELILNLRNKEQELQGYGSF